MHNCFLPQPIVRSYTHTRAHTRSHVQTYYTDIYVPKEHKNPFWNSPLFFPSPPGRDYIRTRICVRVCVCVRIIYRTLYRKKHHGIHLHTIYERHILSWRTIFNIHYIHLLLYYYYYVHINIWSYKLFRLI